VPRDVNDAAPATPSTSRSFHTARSAANSARSLKGSSGLTSGSGMSVSPARGQLGTSPGSARGGCEDEEEDPFDFSFSGAMDPANILREHARSQGDHTK